MLVSYLKRKHLNFVDGVSILRIYLVDELTREIGLEEELSKNSDTIWIYLLDGRIASIAHVDRVNYEGDRSHEGVERVHPDYHTRLELGGGVEERKYYHQEAKSEHQQQNHAEDLVERFDQFR